MYRGLGLSGVSGYPRKRRGPGKLRKRIRYLLLLYPRQKKSSWRDMEGPRGDEGSFLGESGTGVFEPTLSFGIPNKSILTGAVEVGRSYQGQRGGKR